MARREPPPKQPIGDPHDPRGFHVYVHRYLEWMRVQNYSERTVENRESYLGFFVEWARDRGVVRPNQVTKPVLDRYQKWLYHHRQKNGKPLSFRSQHSRLVPLRAFFKWMARNNHILFNPASELELPKLERRLPRHVLSESEAETILNLPDVGEPLGLRDRAILETLYSTGIRRTEVVNLLIFDLDPERGTLMVRQGKGKKDRVVPIGERAAAWIEKYRFDARPRLAREPDDGTLFLTNVGEPIPPHRMTQIVRDYVNQADLGKTGSCHLLRHTVATLLLERGMDLRYIQELLGHAELSTTEIYTKVSIRELKRLHDAMHPASKLVRPADPSAGAEHEVERDELLAALDEEAAEESE